MYKMISKSVLNLEFVLKLEEMLYCMTFENLRKSEGKGNEKKKRKKEEVKVFNTICLEEVEKYEKRGV